jgi:fatty acid-binding protein DegV
MCTAYGGDLSELPKLPGYDKLAAACEECGVTLMQAPMSITGMVNVGEGAVTIGFAAEEHQVEF